MAVIGQPWLHNEFQDSLCYSVTPWLKKTNKKTNQIRKGAKNQSKHLGEKLAEDPARPV